MGAAECEVSELAQRDFLVSLHCHSLLIFGSACLPCQVLEHYLYAWVCLVSHAFFAMRVRFSESALSVTAWCTSALSGALVFGVNFEFTILWLVLARLPCQVLGVVVPCV